MSTNRILSQPGPDGPLPLEESTQLDTVHTLLLASRACRHLLTGEPHLACFDPAELEQAVVLLVQMAATVKPVATEADDLEAQ